MNNPSSYDFMRTQTTTVMRKQTMSFMLRAALFLLGPLVFVGCSGGDEAAAPIIRPVRYEQVFLMGGNRTRVFTGTARAGTETALSFKVAGTVRQVNVAVGGQVRAGQLIAALDAGDYQLKVDQARAALTQAQAQERNAAATYERAQGLYENNNASRSDLDAARAASESAQAGVRAARSQLQLAQQQVNYTRLTAPTGGAVTQVDVEVNENVSAGRAVVVIASGDRPEVDVAVPELFIARMQEGDAATVTFDALPGQVFDAVISEVGVASTRATTFPLSVRLLEEDEAIRPGMAAEVRFQLDTADQRERILVPAVAVGEDREGRFAFVVEPGEAGIGIARRRPVEVGDLTAEGLEVLEGLTDGEIVVTAGISRIADGQQVRLLAAQ